MSNETTVKDETATEPRKEGGVIRPRRWSRGPATERQAIERREDGTPRRRNAGATGRQATGRRATGRQARPNAKWDRTPSRPNAKET